MGQRYIRSVSTSGGLSIPTVEVKDGQCDDTYATQTYTYAASGKLELFVSGGPAECDFYNGTSWTTAPVPLLPGVNTFDSNHQGVKVRNSGAQVQPAAVVTIVRYTT